MKILVTEPILQRFRDVLNTPGHEWVFSDDPAEAPGTHVLVSGQASADLIRACGDDLRLVQVTGAGYEKIDLAALPPNVELANTFHHGRSIAEHVIMVSMMLLRHVPRAGRELGGGTWRTVMTDPTLPFGEVLAGRTIGLVGFGEIGSQVAALAGALGLRVRAVRHSGRPAPGVEWMGTSEQLPELLGSSDIVVVTVPLSDATRGLIDATALKTMRPGAILVNVARGAVVDEQALHDALSHGTIGGAAIDVWWRDPRGPGSPPPSHLDFTGFDNVVLTPHQSGHTDETFRGRAHDIVANIEALEHGRPLKNSITR
ncbi:2-hydroxyacid dehydrogenase [Kineosporia succinea]|uniref:Phosphoglycerate dehydrogenase-like enzyme n=1 Tax=Kineosporia succinea TaxID=84632 RepID=A0ABT9P266_9ACTN|nr:2-hydroxyacid dehydrogenase [Kineosporia succinea]MDP9826743.1 phosphoglycerate dehydrogenase-like enzyme [Kineosporia succinea]